MVCGASNYTYAGATLTQSLGDFVGSTSVPRKALGNTVDQGLGVNREDCEAMRCARLCVAKFGLRRCVLAGWALFTARHHNLPEDVNRFTPQVSNLQNEIWVFAPCHLCRLS